MAMAKGERAAGAEANAEYECLVNIDHTGDGCIYPAGSVVRLDYLPPSHIERLIARGYIKPVRRPVGPPEPADN